MDTLISKESLLGKLEQLPPDQFYNIASIRNFIKAEEEAVTRCRDCKYYAGEGMYCEQNICVQFDHFYCYYGEIEDGR